MTADGCESPRAITRHLKRIVRQAHGDFGLNAAIVRVDLLTHDGYSRTSDNDPSACVKRATTVYLTRLRTPPAGMICPSDHQPFDPQFGEPLSAAGPPQG